MKSRAFHFSNPEEDDSTAVWSLSFKSIITYDEGVNIKIFRCRSHHENTEDEMWLKEGGTGPQPGLFRNNQVCPGSGSGLVFPRGPHRSTSSSPSFPSFQCFSVHFPHLCFLHLQLFPSLDLSVFKPSCSILSSSVRSCVHPVSPPPAFFFVPRVFTSLCSALFCYFW